MKVAGVQLDVALGDREENFRRIATWLQKAVDQGAELTVFPECSLTGYCFESVEEALPHAETVPGPSTQRLAGICRELRTYVVVGLLEQDGRRLFNACTLIGPEGVIGNYRKVHLPFLGIDRFTTPGDRPLQVWPAGEVRVGLNICYDASFPEAARVLALAGADLIVLPTNWPPGAECTADFVVQTRAHENNVYYMVIDRVGTERGFKFIGHSKICAPNGRLLAAALHDHEELLIAEIDPAQARQKRIVRVPGKHEIDRFADRRPEMYGALVEGSGASVERIAIPSLSGTNSALPTSPRGTER